MAQRAIQIKTRLALHDLERGENQDTDAILSVLAIRKRGNMDEIDTLMEDVFKEIGM